MTDVGPVRAVLASLRHEFALLPLTVEAVGPDDPDRAEVVAEHVQLLVTLLAALRRGERTTWSLLVARDPSAAPDVDRLRALADEVEEGSTTVVGRARSWAAAPSLAHREVLVAALVVLDARVHAQLDLAEHEVLERVGRTLTQDELDAASAEVRAGLTADELAIALGLVIADTTAEVGAAILDGLPAAARAAYDAYGRQVFARYRIRLADY